MILKICSFVRKGLKLKVLQETSKQLSLPPLILNRAKGKSTDSRSVKTIKIEKQRFHWFIDCSVEVTCIVTVIILENMFGNIKSAVFTYGGIGEGNVLLSFHVCRCSISASVRHLRLEQS